jgi:hypothetical protein
MIDPMHSPLQRTADHGPAPRVRPARHGRHPAAWAAALMVARMAALVAALLLPPAHAQQAETAAPQAALPPQDAASAPQPQPQPPAPAPSPSGEEALPGFEALEAAGTRIGEVRIVNRNIFDLSDPLEDRLLFRWANKLHIQTRREVIERALLFRTGDPVKASVIEETSRILAAARYLYDVQIRPIAVREGVVDIAVETRDTWTLDAGVTLGRSGGTNSSGYHLNEYNLFGTGVSLSLGRNSTVDRSGSEFRLSQDRAFGTEARFDILHASNSDGVRREVTLAKPFYSLDTRWAGGITLLNDDRLDPVYSGGVLTSQYRHVERAAEVFGGWSAGRVDGWVQRHALGLLQRDNAYAIEPGLAAPADLPVGSRVRAPFLRYELIEDRFDQLQNRNLIGLPETFALGWSARVQLGRTSRALGSNIDTWLYSASIGKGFQLPRATTLLTTFGVDGREGPSQRNRTATFSLRYHAPHHGRWLFYGAADLAVLDNPGPGVALLLGGDNGLRGYPLRYQSGSQRALITMEERYFTDLFLWRLFRVGAAAYVDVGRAWGGSRTNTEDGGWLRDVGLGLRLVNVRSAFGNVLHIDLAFPADADSGVKQMQFLVKTRTSF